MSTPNGRPTLEFKGRMLSVSLLRIYTNDLDQIAQTLRDHLIQAALLRELPVALDLQVQIIDVDGLLAICRKEHLKVIGAVRGAASMEAAVRRTGLAVIRDPGGKGDVVEVPVADLPAAPPPPPQPESAPVAAEPAAAAPPAAEPFAVKVHNTPVRSGQQLYIRQGDLTLTAPVGAGAEVIADGNVHIYGVLRGRAIAGAQGDTNARIFCHSLQAELVAIAGIYVVADDIPAQVRGKPVHIKLDGERLDFQALD